jgi:hypothetical protein
MMMKKKKKRKKKIMEERQGLNKVDNNEARERPPSGIRGLGAWARA